MSVSPTLSAWLKSDELKAEATDTDMSGSAFIAHTYFGGTMSKPEEMVKHRLRRSIRVTARRAEETGLALVATFFI